MLWALSRIDDFSPSVHRGNLEFSIRLVLGAEVTKALRTRKNEKMQRCEAIRQQHEQLRRGDGADQGSSDQVGQRFL